MQNVFINLNNITMKNFTLRLKQICLIAFVLAVALTSKAQVTVTFHLNDSVNNPVQNARIIVGTDTVYPNVSGIATYITPPVDTLFYTVESENYNPEYRSIINVAANLNEYVTLFPKNGPFIVTLNIKDNSNTNPIKGAVLTSMSGDVVMIADINGTIVAPNMYNGYYDFYINAKGYIGLFDNFTVADNNLSKDIFLNPTSNYYNAHFTVKNDSGVSLTGADVNILGFYNALTQADGTVMFDSLSNGNYPYVINKAGYNTLHGTLNIQDNNAFLYPVLMVFDSLSNQFYNAYIYIHDSVGMPVFNAQVNVDGYGMYYTDSSGLATFYGLPEGDYNYSVYYSGYRNFYGNFGLWGNNNTININLMPETGNYYNAFFNVYDDLSNPLANAQINIGGYGMIYTDSLGKATYNNLPEGDYSYNVYAPGLQNYFGNFSLWGANQDIDVYLSPDSISGNQVNLTVTVKNIADGSPITNAQVHISGVSLLYTNATGDVHSMVFESDSIWVDIYADGFMEFHGVMLGVFGSDYNFTVELTPMVLYTTSIQVFDYETNNPIPYAVIWDSYAQTYDTTDINGYKIWPNSTPPGVYHYDVIKDGYDTHRDSMIVVDAPVHHDVYLKRVHTLTINILSIKDSLAIPNAILTVLNVENATGVSDEMGKIIFEYVPNDTYDFEVVANGYFNKISSFTVTNSDTVAFIYLSPEVYKLTLNVSNESGEKIIGAKVILDSIVILTNNEGKAIFNGVTSGNHSYTIEAGGYEFYSNSLEVFNSDFTEFVQLYPQYLIVSANITGSAVFGETLTVVIDSSNNTGTLKYQWMRESMPIAGANSNSYVIQESDINKYLSCEITSTIQKDFSNVYNNDMVMKASQSKPAIPIIDIVTHNSISVIATAGMEYSIDTIMWQLSSQFNGLAENTQYSIYQRRVETNTHLASESSASVLALTNAAPANALTGSVTINTTVMYNDTLTAIVSSNNTGTLSYQWKRNGVNISGATSSTYIVEVDDIGFSLSVIISSSVENGSLGSNETFAVNKAMNYAIPVDPAIQDSTTNSITLVSVPGYEYSSNYGSTWQVSPVFENLYSGSMYSFVQRIAATSAMQASVQSMEKYFYTENVYSATFTIINDSTFYIEGVEIQIDNNHYAVTDLSGKAYFYDLTAGNYNYTIYAYGYKKSTGTFTISNQTENINITLERQVADFSYIVSGDTVWFMNTSSSNLNEFTWEFGDGFYYDEDSPIHIYPEPGYYEVCLSAKDSIAGDYISHCKEIEVIGTGNVEICKAAFSINKLSNATIKFENTSPNSFDEFFWSFGDGNISFEENVTYNYSESGYYLVEFEAYNKTTGCFAKSHKEVFIEIPNSQNTYAKASFDFFINVNEVKFINTSQGTYTDLIWSFGDDNFAFENTYTNTYMYPGFYEVCLTVFDSASGNVSDDCKMILISSTPSQQNTAVCNANFDYFISKDTVRFTAKTAGNISDYSWNFGNGKKSTLKNPVHKYAEPGFYTVELTTFDSISDCMSTIEKTIFITHYSKPVCNAAFKAYVEKETVSFKNSSTGNISEYHWDFGDGYYSNEKNPVHKYKKPNYYDVYLVTFDTVTGCVSETHKVISVLDVAVATCKASFKYFAKDLEVNFSGIVNGEATEYFWDFGDGNYAFDKDTFHIYNEPGYYVVTFTAYNSNNDCMSYFTNVVYVFKPELSFCNASFNTYIKDNDVRFTNTSTGDADEYFWFFGDGAYGFSDSVVTHKYSKPGLYEVILTSYDSKSECIDTYYDEIVISETQQVSCKADFSFATKGLDVTFSDQSRGEATFYFWDFGDGNYDTLPNTKHSYKEGGYYQVYHMVYNEANLCIDEIVKEVVVLEPDAKICKSDFYFIAGNSGNVKFYSKAVGNFDAYSWDFGDGLKSNIKNPVHNYTEPGYYDVSLTVNYSNDTVLHTSEKQIYIKPEGKSAEPVLAKFSSNASISSLNVKFENRSLGAVSEWYWDFGDNTKPSAESNPVHVYTESGYYNVCLTVNNAGYQNTKCKAIAVGNVSNKHSAFFTYFADTAKNTIFFNNKSRGDIVSQKWNFGDNGTSAEKKPAHSYLQKGSYAVCLTTVSSGGSEKTFCRNVNISDKLIDTCTYNCVWPGDANNDLEANHYDIFTIGMNYGMEGPVRKNASNVWKGQSATLWANYQADSTNNMHGDCNGDGIINLDDTIAIRNNFAYSHSAYPENFTKAGAWTLSCEIGEVPTKGAATTRTVRSILTEPSDKAVNDLYAVGYELELVGAEGVNWNGISVNFNGTFLGNVANDLITFYTVDESKKQIFISLSRNDQQNISSSGAVSVVYLPFPDGGGANLEVIATSKGGILADGQKVQVNGGNYYISSLDKNVGFTSLDVDVYPNPNNGTFSIQSESILKGTLSIELTDLIGNLILSNEYKVENGFFNQTIKTENLPQGIYMLQISNEGLVKVIRVVIQ